MPVREMKKLRKSYRARNKRLIDAYLATEKAVRKTFDVGDTVDGDTISPDTVFYIAEGHCIRYIVDSQGNYQAVAIIGPEDILGLSTRLNYLRVPGGVNIIDTITGVEIPMNLLIEWTKSEPLFMYENMQHDYMQANSALRMNNMDKKTKIYYTLIELLQDNHVKDGDSLHLNPYINQTILAEFSGCSKGYVSKVIAELKKEQILRAPKNGLICDDPQKLIALSEPHQDFSLADIFS